MRNLKILSQLLSKQFGKIDWRKYGPNSCAFQFCFGGRTGKGFRKGLSKEDQEAFDRLFDRAKFHTAAGVYMAHPYPLETVLLSICLEHEKMLADILGKLKEREGMNE